MNTKFINIGCKTFEVAKQVFFLNSQYSKKDSRFCSLIFEFFQPTIEFFCFGYLHNKVYPIGYKYILLLIFPRI